MDSNQIRKLALELAKDGNIVVAIPKSVGTAGDMMAYQLLSLAQKSCPQNPHPICWRHRSPSGNREIFVFADGNQLVQDEVYLEKFVTQACDPQCDASMILVYE